MTKLHVTRRQILKTAGVVGVFGAVGAPTEALAATNAKYRVDVSVNVLGGCTAAGGKTTARTWDHVTRIEMDGFGTFRDTPGRPQSVTGGGTWATFSATGTPTGTGTYEMVGFVLFMPAPGSLPSTFPDCIGVAENRRAGLVYLRIVYEDGSEGTLGVSCRLAGSPATMAEGISVNKGNIAYWHNDEPAPGVEGNRTLFHILK
jgi:hypothetical protein